VALAFMRKEKAANNPWGAGATTLEWTLPSPPPFHQFETLPVVGGPSLGDTDIAGGGSQPRPHRYARLTRRLTEGNAHERDARRQDLYAMPRRHPAAQP
jgi:heme/copper-type cytochrome/quinol oxidase subunit 1